MKDVTFPYATGRARGTKHTISADDFLRAWHTLVQVAGGPWFATNPSTAPGEMPCYANKTATLADLTRDKPFSLELLCRRLVPKSSQNTGQALPQFFELNAHIIERGRGVSSPHNMRVIGTARLSGEARKRLSALGLALTPTAVTSSHISLIDKLGNDLLSRGYRRTRRLRGIAGTEVYESGDNSVVVVNSIHLSRTENRERAINEYFSRLIKQLSRTRPAVSAIVLPTDGSIKVPIWFKTWCRAQGIQIQVSRAQNTPSVINNNNEPFPTDALLERVRDDYSKMLGRFDQTTYPDDVYEELLSAFERSEKSLPLADILKALLWKFGKHNSQGYPSSYNRLAKNVHALIKPTLVGTTPREFIEHLEQSLKGRAHSKAFITSAFLAHLANPKDVVIIDQHNLRATYHYLGFPENMGQPKHWEDIQLVNSFSSAVLMRWSTKYGKSATPTPREFDKFLMVCGKALKSHRTPRR